MKKGSDGELNSKGLKTQSSKALVAPKTAAQKDGSEEDKDSESEEESDADKKKKPVAKPALGFAKNTKVLSSSSSIASKNNGAGLFGNKDTKNKSKIEESEDEEDSDDQSTKK